MPEPQQTRDTTLAELLSQAMEERGVSLSQLVGRSGVPKTTLHRWLTGDVVHPYHRDGLLSVVAALGLRKVAANRLLRAAGLPSLSALAAGDVPEERALLARWSPSVQTNLPAPLTSFVGREQEITQIAELTCQDDVRLVTLTGSGGSGKTRLAIRTAEEVLDAFGDGVFFVSLAAVADPSRMIPAIASSVGVRDVVDGAIRGRLVAWLRTRRVLLLLDNLEQLVEGSAVIVDLLQDAPGLTVLATSRVPLQLTGECVWRVEPFPIPHRHSTPHELRENSAVALFLQRAHVANPHYTILDEELSYVAEICARLDGLPLAIELAAARIRDHQVDQLLADFPSRLDLSGEGPRDAPVRQRTLRATIIWSLKLLPEPVRSFFVRLTVFAGGWTAVAARVVCAADGTPATSVDEMLQTLLEANLIRKTSRPDVTTRYELHEITREYGRERLEVDGDETMIRDRHAHYVLDLAESVPPYVPEVRASDWYERIDADLDNVRAALDWISRRDDPDTWVRLVAALWPYWHEYLGVEEGRHWLDSILARRTQLSLVQQSSLLTGACLLASSQSAFDESEEAGQDALTLCRQLDDHRGQAIVLRQLGWSSYMQGVCERTIGLFETALDEWRLTEDSYGIALALSDLAVAHCVLGSLDAAGPLMMQAHAYYDRLHDERGLGRSLADQGLYALLCGDLPASMSLLERAVRQLRATGRGYVLSVAIFYLGMAYCFAGKLDKAIGCHLEALEMQEAVGEQAQIALIFLGFAAVAYRQGDGVRSAVLCGASQAIQQRNQIVLPPAVQTLYQREVESLLDQVNSATFDRAFTQGSQMTMAEAVAFAREGLVVTPR